VSTPTLYTVVYFGGILAAALLEWALPRRPFGESTGLRWFGNFGLQIIGGVLVRALFPLFGVGWAAFCREHGLGFFNVVHWPAWIAFALTIPALDLAAYAQHYVLHRVPVLWRVHRAHHSDLDCDFSTGLRFHPFEAVYSTAIQSSVILALGVPPAAVLLKRAANIAKGSGVPNKTKVGTVTAKQVEDIARLKLPDLNCESVDSAVRSVRGTARSMGLDVLD